MALARVLVVAVLLAVGVGAGRPTTSEPDRQAAEAFLQQLGWSTVDDISMQVDQVAYSSLRSSVEESRLVLLGHDRGAQDASAIYTVVRDLQLRGIGLDWPARLQGSVAGFVRTGAVSDELVAAGREGVVPADHLEMLRRLHDEGLLDHLFLYGDDGPQPAGATADMARVVLQRSSSRIPTIVLALRDQVGTGPVRMPDGSVSRPMIEDIRRVVPDVAVIELSYDVEGQPSLYRRPDGSYVVELAGAAGRQSPTGAS